jgi:hypothetical protein
MTFSEAWSALRFLNPSETLLSKENGGLSGIRGSLSGIRGDTVGQKTAGQKTAAPARDTDPVSLPQTA